MSFHLFILNTEYTLEGTHSVCGLETIGTHSPPYLKNILQTQDSRSGNTETGSNNINHIIGYPLLSGFPQEGDEQKPGALSLGAAISLSLC